MSLVNLDQDRDVAQEDVETKTSYEITSLTAAQNKNINSFVAESTSTGYLNNAQGTATTIPLSSAFRHIANYYFSSTAGTNIPIAHDNTSFTSLLRAITIGRTTMDDNVVSGSITAIFAFGTTANNTYIDQPETTITGNVGRKGSLVSQGNTSNVVGTVFYESGVLIFHGGTGWPHFLITSASGMTFGSASAGYVVCTQLSWNSMSILKRTNFFCRAFNKEFNYTNNPTAISNSTLGTITSSLTANPRTYITSVGLYNDDGDLLAISKVSPPVQKDFTKEKTFSVQLQY